MCRFRQKHLAVLEFGTKNNASFSEHGKHNRNEIFVCSVNSVFEIQAKMIIRNYVITP